MAVLNLRLPAPRNKRAFAKAAISGIVVATILMLLLRVAAVPLAVRTGSATVVQCACAIPFVKVDSKFVSTKRYERYTPLAVAVAECRPDMVSVLLRNGANPTVNVGSSTPIPFVPFYEHFDEKSVIEIFQLLQGCGVKFDQIDSRGRTPLHCAAGSRAGHGT